MRVSNPFFVAETTTTTGTGNITLSGTAIAAHRRFQDALTTTGADFFYYRIEGVDTNNLPTGEWENGIGRLTASTTLARLNIVESSSGGTVNFSAGTKWVYVYAQPFDLRRWHLSGTQIHDFALAGATASPPFLGAAVSSGTLAAIAGTPNHPGVVQLRSSTTTNSGYRLETGATSTRIQGGEYFCIAFRIPTLTNTTVRLGYRDNATSADVTDGVYIEIPGTGAAVFKTANNGGRTTSATIATLSINTWYSAHIFVRGDASEASGLIANESGVVQGVQFNSANIPTASGRETGVGVIATSSNTAITNLLDVDYMAFTWTKGLVR